MTTMMMGLLTYTRNITVYRVQGHTLSGPWLHNGLSEKKKDGPNGKTIMVPRPINKMTKIIYLFLFHTEKHLSDNEK